MDKCTTIRRFPDSVGFVTQSSKAGKNCAGKIFAIALDFLSYVLNQYTTFEWNSVPVFVDVSITSQE